MKTTKKERRFRARNLSFLAKHPERRLAKVELDEKAGEYFPPHILAIPDATARKDAMKDYAELKHMLYLQKKYRKSCQREQVILSLSKKLGLFPQHYVKRDNETKSWERRWRKVQIEKARKTTQAKFAARKKYRKSRKHLNYAAQLALELKKSGAEPLTVRKRPGRKCAFRVVTYFGEREVVQS